MKRERGETGKGNNLRVGEGIFHEGLGANLFSDLDEGDGDVLGEDGATEAIVAGLAVEDVAGLEQVGRCHEGVVSVQGCFVG